MVPKANGYTRQEILTQIKLNGTMTAESLGHSLGISPVAVRQHLSALLAESLVSATVERRPVGRPVNRFQLTRSGDEAFPRAYATLAADVLEEVRTASGDAGVRGVFARLCARAVQSHQPKVADRSFREKIEVLADLQAGAGYMAKVGPVSGGLALVQHNCAICHVANRFPAACDSEQRFFEALVGPDTTVERVSHIPSGDHTCTFLFRPRETEPAE
jgi:predicted ArsR family transcriptional regulator